MEQDISFINNIGVVLRGNPFLLAGIIVQSRNEDTINTPPPNLSFLPLVEPCLEKNVKKKLCEINKKFAGAVWAIHPAKRAIRVWYLHIGGL